MLFDKEHNEVDAISKTKSLLQSYCISEVERNKKNMNKTSKQEKQ